MHESQPINLIAKYNIPGPRYTSYPTVPFWDTASFDLVEWKKRLVDSFDQSNKINGISLYIHLPFCENLCTFCGCNKRITKNHSVEEPYIDALIQEWQLYLNIFGARPIIKEIHLGGGTPTFFKPDNLKRLLETIFSTAEIASNPLFGFEAHPNHTSKQHLETLYQLGFRRISFGVQEYNPDVQKAINRIQPFEIVKKVTFEARETGYTSVSHDLVFGLPKQKTEHIIDTVEKTISIKPDRISFYSYAHVPWIKGTGQRGFSESDLPDPVYKRQLYETGREMFQNAGYVEIGMDHFALPHDSLYIASQNGHLHRNFMGYTESYTRLMIGLGVSSIGDTWTAFGQNEKNLEDYYQKISLKEFPVYRGHLLNDEDLIFRKHILNLMCRFETYWDSDEFGKEQQELIFEKLQEPLKDGLIVLNENSLTVLPQGRPFIRNICMAFDMYLQRQNPKERIFSMTV